MGNSAVAGCSGVLIAARSFVENTDGLVNLFTAYSASINELVTNGYAISAVASVTQSIAEAIPGNHLTGDDANSSLRLLIK